MGEMGRSRYQLRFAAGQYWILDMEQAGIPYKKPLMVNEIGAGIWEMGSKGMGREEIAECLCREYHAGRQEVLEDIDRFRKQLETAGYSFQEGVNE